MKYLILTMFLTVVQTAPPIPRKAADSTTGASHKAQKKASSDQAPASPQPTAANPLAPGPEQRPSSPPSTKDTEQSVRVRELPPVSIKKDRSDWGIWAFNGLLVIVGGFQVWLLYKHAGHLENLATATENNASALIKSERAWVLVKVGEIPEFKTGDLAIVMLPIVKNYGKSVARIVRFSVQYRIVGSPENLPAEPEYRRDSDTDIVLPPDTPIQPMNVPIPQHEFQEAVEARSILYIYGYIDYLILEKERKQTRFCFMYYSELASWGPLKPGFYVGIQAPEAYKKCT